MDSLAVDLRLPLRDFDLELSLEIGRETVALVGPSGAGKTTVLRAVAGLVEPHKGRVVFGTDVWFDSERGIDRPVEDRSIGLVFQDYALFPHLTVVGNVAFAARDGIGDLLDRFRLTHLARAYPAELSGGERQRVALARALARRPSVLLLDEPMAALDAQTRAGVRAELGGLLRELSLPTLIVTHDFEDAATLADRVGVLVDGKILQVGAPDELVAAPADPFVATFTGANVIPGRARRLPSGLTEVRLADGTIVYSTEEAEGEVGLVVHPWEVSLGRTEPLDSSLNHITGPIASLVRLGNRARVRVADLTAELTVASAERLGLDVGEVIVASFKATATRLVPLRRGPS
ncbi:MAG: ABC transporter ATP-binding protein [Actinomycetota bacterium]